jgi:predicted dehydrogenase
MSELRFVLLGTGFWARFQLAAWREVEGARCVGLYNRTRAKAEALARDFGVSAVYEDAAALLEKEKPDFVDIVTDPSTHARFVGLAAERRIPVICQKPLAPSLPEAEAMAETCRRAGVPLLVHENWRWQAPLRGLKRAVDGGAAGRPFRARIQFSSSFPVFDKQPFLRDLERFLLADVGVHLLDVVRFLFGEAESLFATTRRVNPEIRGEDVASVLLRMRSGVSVSVELSYASRWEHERFPETFALVEADRGSIALGPAGEIRTTTAAGTTSAFAPPPRHAWADPAYALVHASIVPCHRDLLRHLRGEGTAETTAEDNLRTLRLVDAAYESARTGRSVEIPS